MTLLDPAGGGGMVGRLLPLKLNKPPGGMAITDDVAPMVQDGAPGVTGTLATILKYIVQDVVLRTVSRLEFCA